MAATPELVQFLAENLRNLYLGTDDAARRRADHFLQKIQRGPESWALADAILGGRTPFAPRPPDLSADAVSPHAVTFASMTLHCKVSGDLHELSGDQASALRQAALGHLNTWSAQGVPIAVTKKLSLAVAALAVSTSWEGALPHVQQSLQGDDTDIEKACRTRSVAVELLAALPEQCFSKQFNVPLSRREHFNRYLRDASAGVLDVLTSLVAWASGTARQASPQGADRLTVAAFECLSAWISFCDIPPEKLAASPLFAGAFDALDHPKLFEVATDVVVESLRRFNCRDPRCAPLIGLVAPKIMALAPRLERAKQTEDDDEGLGITRLFCEMGEAYLPMIASERDCNQVSITEVLMACTEFPSRKVSQVPFRFWYHLAKAISKLENQETQQKLRQLLKGTYVRLARLCVRLSARTENDVDATADDKDADADDYEAHRQDLFDALGDCCCVVGNQAVLEAIAEELKVAAAPATATCDGVESCLFALRGVADYVGHSDESIVAPALQFVCTLPADWRRARRQGAVLIGAYAKWLKRHPASLQPCVQFLLEELSAETQVPRGRREPSASRAAKAITQLCHRCAVELAAANFVQVRDQIANQVPLKDELSVLEGLGAVVAAAATYEDVVRGTQTLAQPPADALAILAQTEQVDPKAVARELDRLTAVMRCACPRPELLHGPPPELLRRPHPVLEVFAKLWPVFEVVAGRLQASHLVIEKLCRCYKHAMRSCRKHFEPMLDKMMAHLIKALEQGVTQGAGQSAPLSSFVYCCSITITEFGDEARMVPKLLAMVTQVSQACLSLLQSPQAFAEHPDLVEEYFYFASRFLDYCPGSLLGSPLLGHILHSASVGLRVEHREALRGILHFCGEAASAAVLAIKKSGDPLPLALQADGPLEAKDAPRSQEEVDLARAAAQAVRRLLVEQDAGRALVDGLLAALSGDLPAQFLEEGRGSLLGCLWKLRLFCPPEVFARWCGASLEVITANFASTEIAGDLINAVSVDPPRHDAFHDAFVVFARCFQTNKRGRRSHR